MTDCVGTEFEVGQVITYPGRYSSSLYVRKAVVREVLKDSLVVEVYDTRWRWDEGEQRHGYFPYAYRTTISQAGRATVTSLSEELLRKRLK